LSALSYTECEIDRGVVASARTTFEELHAAISGRSGEYNTITQPVGFEFTDLVGEGLRSAAEENHFSWSSSMMACTHAYGVLDKISTDVQWYEDKIEEIKGNLSTALGNASEPDNLTIVQQIVESHNLDAERAWRDLETRCDESEEMLRGGPTPENIRALAEGGHLGEYGLIGFYTTNDLNYFYVDESQAETIATHIENAVLHGYDGSIEALEDHPEFLALIGNVVARAQTAQQNGDELLDGEIEFLETLFGDLGAVDGDDPGFLAFMDQVNSSEHISDSLRGDISRNLANSMLVLSDENIGGGMDRLPQDVVDVMDVPDFPDVNSLHHDSELSGFMDTYSDWGQPFTTLSNFLDSAGPGIQGGTEFSTTLMGTVAATLDVPYFAAGEPGDEHFQNVIDVASRNDEANYIILTGEDFEGNEFQHHASHGDLTPEKILETFYTHNWPDDGAAVSGITDWIPSYQQSSDEDKVLIGDNAFLGLIDATTGTGIEEKLNQTGEWVDDPNLKDEDGNPIRWENVSFGHLNPEIAESFADIFLANLDTMGSDYGIDPTDPDAEIDQDNSIDPMGNILIHPDDRAAFTQYIMGSEESAILVKAQTFAAADGDAIEFMGDGEGRGDPGLPKNSAILNALVDNAITQESESRVNATNEVIDYRKKVFDNVVDVVFAGIPGAENMPIADMGVEALKVGIKEMVSADHVADDSSGDVGSNVIQIQNRALLHAAGEMNQEDFSEFGFDIPEGVVVTDENGDFVSDWTQWSYSELAGENEGEPLSPVSRSEVHDAIMQGFTNNSDSPVSNLLVNYNTSYNDYYDAV
jgi:hypothetical protein